MKGECKRVSDARTHPCSIDRYTQSRISMQQLIERKSQQVIEKENQQVIGREGKRTFSCSMCSSTTGASTFPVK